MVIYRYTKKPGSKILGYTDPTSGKATGFLKDDEILVNTPPIDTGGSTYIQDMRTGIYYLFNEKLLTKQECVESTLVPQCKRGIDIFDSTHEQRTVLTHVERGGKILLTLDFNTDKSGNIWARVFLLNDDGSYKLENGYIIYKNARNNFANVAISGWKYTTVLSNGNVDNEKVEAVRQLPITTVRPNMKRAARAVSANANMNTVTLTAARQGVITSNVKSATGNLARSYATEVARHGPKIVQNPSGFPPVVRFDSSRQMYEYNYALNYSGSLANLDKIYANHNLDIRSIQANRNANIERYNRFKLAYPDDILSRGYMHVFFTRPDCNFLDAGGSLNSQVRYNPEIKYMNQRSPALIRQLVQHNGSNHQFMMLLSNKSKAFPLTDDGINSETAGKSRGGYSIAFGRRRDSEVGGSISINYRDTRNLDIINLHKLWADYIVNVYQGTWSPKMQYINGRVLDYAVAVYVIVTAEDFETIIFWSKYYGVFPVSVPYSQISWDGEASTVKAPDLSVSYRYSWKEDLNPIALLELNMNAFKDSVPQRAAYQPTFNPSIGMVSKTWTGAPFVETIRYLNSNKNLTDGSLTTMKLRFRPS